jgi:hypothetical protein
MIDKAKETTNVSVNKAGRTKSDKPTKKEISFEKRVIQNFDNMIFSLKSVTPGFIITNIETLERAQSKMTPKGKQYIADEAFTIQENNKADSKIMLPKEWQILINFAD